MVRVRDALWLANPFPYKLWYCPYLTPSVLIRIRPCPNYRRRTKPPFARRTHNEYLWGRECAKSALRSTRRSITTSGLRTYVNDERTAKGINELIQQHEAEKRFLHSDQE